PGSGFGYPRGAIRTLPELDSGRECAARTLSQPYKFGSGSPGYPKNAYSVASLFKNKLPHRR
ncbi:hypothetical protein CCACVL1_03845, partial [Corchorus capsularis]